MVAEEQCPSCEFNTYTNICARKRQRINKNPKGEFFKSTPCPLWAKKMDRSTLLDLAVCPTCGQRIPKPELMTGQIGNISKVSIYTGPMPKTPEEEPKGELVAEIELTGTPIIPEEPPIEKSPVEEKPKRGRRRSTDGKKKARRKVNDGGSQTT